MFYILFGLPVFGVGALITGIFFLHWPENVWFVIGGVALIAISLVGWVVTGSWLEKFQSYKEATPDGYELIDLDDEGEPIYQKISS